MAHELHELADLYVTAVKKAIDQEDSAVAVKEQAEKHINVLHETAKKLKLRSGELVYQAQLAIAAGKGDDIGIHTFKDWHEKVVMVRDDLPLAYKSKAYLMGAKKIFLTPYEDRDKAFATQKDAEHAAWLRQEIKILEGKREQLKLTVDLSIGSPKPMDNSTAKTGEKGQDLGVWEAPPKPAPVEIPMDELPEVKEAKAALYALPLAQRKHVLTWSINAFIGGF